MGRNEKCFCGSGKKVKKCHPTISNNSKLADIYVCNQKYDAAIEREFGQPKCPINCSSCCSHFFFIDESEFLLILDNILYKGGTTLLKEYINEAKEYQAYLEMNFPETMNKLDEFMPRSNAPDSEYNNSFFNDNMNWDRSKPCIMLKDGKCSVYEVRPNVCRTFGTSGYCEIIKNMINTPPEQDDMVRESRYYYDGKNIILTRPYPLFYYFSFFLTGQYYDITMSKLNRIRKSKSVDYAKFRTELNKSQ